MKKSVGVKKAVLSTQNLKGLRLSSRRWIIGGAAILLALAIGIYVWQSAVHWRQLEAKSVAGLQESKKRAMERLSVTGVKINDITEVVKQLHQDKEVLCAKSYLFDWQASLNEDLSGAVKQCEARRAELLRASNIIDKLSQRLRAENELAKALRLVQQNISKGDKNDIGKLQEAWSAGRTQIIEIKLDPSLEDSRKQLLSGIGEIEASLNKLKEANEAEKRPEYDDAIQELSRAYDKLSSISTASTESYQKITSQVIDSLK